MRRAGRFTGQQLAKNPAEAANMKIYDATPKKTNRL
jgi:hypothetical protein